MQTAYRCIPKLVGAALVHSVGPALVDVHQEHQVVSEDTQAMQPGHLDHKSKQIVHNGVQELVGHLAPRQRRHALQLVVDVQLQPGHKSDIQFEKAKRDYAVGAIQEKLKLDPSFPFGICLFRKQAQHSNELVDDVPLQ